MAEPFGLFFRPERCKNFDVEEGRRGRETEILMWKYIKTDERETEGGRGRREETQGDRRGDVPLMI